jgi:hypothetical protein
VSDDSPDDDYGLCRAPGALGRVAVRDRILDYWRYDLLERRGAGAVATEQLHISGSSKQITLDPWEPKFPRVLATHVLN